MVGVGERTLHRRAALAASVRMKRPHNKSAGDEEK